MEAYSGETGWVDISSERQLGLIGSILVLLGSILSIGGIGGLFSLIGLVLLLISLHGIGNKLGDERPFKYYLRGFIIGLVGVIIGIIIIVGAMAAYSHPTNEIVYHDSSGFTLYEEDLGIEDSELTTTGVVLAVVGFIIILAAIVLDVYYQKKAWEAMYEITGVEAFKDTAKFLWWGLLTLVILVGAILLLIAAIYQIIAFSNLPQRIKRAPTPQQNYDEFSSEPLW